MKNQKQIGILILVLLSCTGCADVTPHVETYGFWHGLWHGFIFPLSFIVSLFMENVAVYACDNNRGWYNFGFLLGSGTSVIRFIIPSSKK